MPTELVAEHTWWHPVHGEIMSKKQVNVELARGEFLRRTQALGSLL